MMCSQPAACNLFTGDWFVGNKINVYKLTEPLTGSCTSHFTGQKTEVGGSGRKRKCFLGSQAAEPKRVAKTGPAVRGEL